MKTDVLKNKDQNLAVNKNHRGSFSDDLGKGSRTPLPWLAIK